MIKKEYKIGEVFKHTDGNVYQCVKGETCEGCAFKLAGKDCYVPYCGSSGRNDGLNVKYIPVTEPVDGMLFRAKNGRMYWLTRGDHWQHTCACDGDKPQGCATLDRAVFGHNLSREWYWAPVEEDTPVESPKPAEPPKRHIELAVVRVEDDEVTFRIAAQPHRNYGLSQQAESSVFRAINGILLSSAEYPEWKAGARRLYCRGYEADRDNLQITCTAAEFAKICEAMTEYNATDGKGYEKPWPQKGDNYFYITKEGTVDRCIYSGSEAEHKMRSFGNCFKSAKAAETAVERIRKAMKG